MTNEEYKKLSINEFTKAAGRYERDHAGIYEMCKKDYQDILAELEKDQKCLWLIYAGMGTLLFRQEQWSRSVVKKQD